MLTCPRSSLSFHSNAHHHGSLPQQLGMVWDLLLKADPEGPSPIFHAALRHSFHTPTVTPQHVSLQHTLVQEIQSARLIGAWFCGRARRFGAALLSGRCEPVMRAERRLRRRSFSLESAAAPP